MRPQLRIIPAAFADIGRIWRMAKVAFPATYAATHTPEQIAFMLDWMYAPHNIAGQMAGGHAFFIGVCRGKDIGYVSVCNAGGGLHRLERLYVLPSQQGRGFGAQMLAFAVRHARNAAGGRAARLELNVFRGNARAIAFYKQQGFREKLAVDRPIGNGFYMTDYFMELPIPACRAASAKRAQGA